MLRRGGLILTLALGLLAAPLPAESQKAGKVHRIGFLAALSPGAGPANRDAFLQGLRERGWVEGKNLIIERRYARGRYERLPDLAAELVGLEVDVIVAVGPPPSRAAKRATTTIPIVMVAVGDPVGMGLVASLARPEGNVTGLTLFAGPEMVAKNLELLKEAVPSASRVAVLWNPATRANAPYVSELEVPARALGVRLQILEARDPDDFDSAFAAMTRERAGALLVLPDPMFFAHRTRLAALAAESHLPAMHGLTVHAKAGGLMAYAADLPDLFRRSATYVDKILRGTKPADLPVEQPTRFNLVINLKTAKALGLTFPESILIRATEVIE